MASDKAPYIFLAQMDIAPGHEDDFNRIYDEEHIPSLLKVPGVRACHRYEVVNASREGTPRYLAIYELDSPEVKESAAWKAALEIGDWVRDVRPHTQNRQHSMFRKRD